MLLSCFSKWQHSRSNFWHISRHLSNGKVTLCNLETQYVVNLKTYFIVAMIKILWFLDHIFPLISRLYNARNVT